MVLFVDFNMREPDGRIPALLVGDAARVALGESVIASDGEGVQCRAVVSEVSPDGRYAMLETVGGIQRDSTLQPSASDLFAGGWPSS
jgi:hypothetical protein